jgi:RecJ-like exonuclease
VINVRVQEQKAILQKRNVQSVTELEKFRSVSRSVFGQFVNITACANCNGEGEVIDTPCKKCMGDGRINEEV